MFQPRVTVAAVIERDGRYLMVKETAEAGLIAYNQPAGHLEANESLVEAAIRETREETGWSLIPDAVTGLYLYTSPFNQLTYLRVCFSGTALPPTGQPVLDDGIIDALWLSRDELNLLPLRSELVIRCIDDYQAGAAYPLSMLHRLLPS